MATYDSLINVDEWISDHYFTTDEGESFSKRVRNRTKEWATFEAESGAPSPVKRLQAERGELQQAFATQSPTDAPVNHAFSYGPPEEQHYTRAGETFTYQGWVGNAGTLVVISAEAAEGTTEEDLTTLPVAGGLAAEGKDPDEAKVSKLVGDLFLAVEPPEFIVVLAGAWALLAERESWPLGRYLAINLQLAVERNDTKKAGELERVAVILARENLERAADGTTWWAETREESQQHAVKVSGDLRDAVRESIEIIGNDVLDRRRDQNLPIEGVDGNELAHQSLRYLYRILFLLFAEASPELAILPTGAPEYVDGYGLDRLRDQILNPPVTDRERRGTHLYDSLQLLFTQVNDGHDPLEAADADEDAQNEGLTFRNLEADLFKREATALIDEVKLSNDALTRVLQNLLLSKVAAGKDRGFISYATLGVTELGQVYEGLMSYHGFIAQEDLYEVAPRGDASKGSWVLPTHAAETVPQDSFVMEAKQMEEGGTSKVRREHPVGSFVFRQSSRDRERSASFYTPQVLTEFTVGQAIEVLQEEGRIESAEDVLTLTICEPAMGSGAFAVEAVRQLAEMYLKLREDELDEQVAPEERTAELQMIKAHIALHQVYGVDLNPTAVELAEISLWLDTMTSQLKAPWFGLHLRRGNSLIGALRATYSPTQLKKREWLSSVPRREPVQHLAEAIDAGETKDIHTAGRIHQFLLPSSTWGAAADAKDLKALAKDEIAAMKAWRKAVTGKSPTTEQAKQLKNLAARVESLWAITLSKMRIAENQIRRDIDLWGRVPQRNSKDVRREQIEKELLHNEQGAYLRLRLAMDAWNALTFWPLTATDELPDLDEWIATLTDLLGREVITRDAAQTQLGRADSWDELVQLERTEIELSGARHIDTVLEKHPWLNTVRTVAAEQGFFHWDLDFAAVFARGGFDLQVGNPPWVRPDVKIDDLYAELDPWFALAHKPTQAVKKERRERLNTDSRIRELVFAGAGETVATASVLGNVPDYPHLKDQRPDLYRGFIEVTWRDASQTGVISLLHPETHLIELDAVPLRRVAYRRLRQHWQFENRLKLFEDPDSKKVFSVSIYGSLRDSPDFISASSLYHPRTAKDSLFHDGTGEQPGFKNADGEWDLAPHKHRVNRIQKATLMSWQRLWNDTGLTWNDTRVVYTVNTMAQELLSRLAEYPRMSELDFQSSQGWNESTGRRNGYFEYRANKRVTSVEDVVLKGRQIRIGLPFAQEAIFGNDGYSYLDVDLEAMNENFLPSTEYVHAETVDKGEYGTWADPNTGERTQVLDHYRISWRLMAQTKNARSLFTAILPPRVAHINGIQSLGPIRDRRDVIAAANMSTMVIDFLVRSAGYTNLYPSAVVNLPMIESDHLDIPLVDLFLRLNCLTTAYAPLWKQITGSEWAADVPLRVTLDRLRAQSEIDAIMAVKVGISADELVSLYETQFPVQMAADQKIILDKAGRQVPPEVLRGQTDSEQSGETGSVQWSHPQSGVTYTSEFPFETFDRKAELRKAHEKYNSV